MLATSLQYRPLLIFKKCRESNQERCLITFAFQDLNPDTNPKPYFKFTGSNPVPLVVGMWVGIYSAHSRYAYVHKKSTSFHLDKCQAGVDVEGLQQLLTVDIPPDMEISSC